MKKEITGEDVAALLHHIHDHAELITRRVNAAKDYERNEDKLEEIESEIYYSESELLPVLKALGLPEPIWKRSVSVEEWLAERNAE